MRAWLSQFKVRVTLTYLVILLVSATIMAVRAGSGFARTALENAKHDLGVQAFVVASALAHPGVGRGDDDDELIAIPDLERLAGRLAADANGQLTILDPFGNVIATSLGTALPNQRAQPEVTAALGGGMAYAVRRDPVAGQEMIYTAALVQSGEHTYGLVQIAVPMVEVTVQARRFWLGLGLTALLAAAVATTAGWWLAGRLVRPVGRLRDAAARLAAGNLEERVPLGGAAEMVQLSGAFNDMAARIEASMKAQRAFVANASHELRTPLTNIKLRAEALEDGALDDPPVARKFVQEIGSEADRLSRMADDLLTLSRQDSAPRLVRERVDLSTLMPAVTGEMALRAEKGDVALVLEVAPGLPVLSADPADLRTLLLNLLDNALQYTEPGGRITVRAQPASSPSSVLIEVEDTGSGIAAEDLAHIFGRFYRADKARRRGTGMTGSGAGLGLAIVKGIAEGYGGTVSAESALGQGTTICVRLPADADLPPEVDDARSGQRDEMR
jgi:signal transduction histidine kinase